MKDTIIDLLPLLLLPHPHLPLICQQPKKNSSPHKQQLTTTTHPFLFMHKRLSLFLHFITSQTQKQFLSTKKVQQSHIITAITHNHDNHNINKSGYGKITFCIFLSLQYSMVCKKIPNQQTPKSNFEKKIESKSEWEPEESESEPEESKSELESELEPEQEQEEESQYCF
jgi:hypothetical protein